MEDRETPRMHKYVESKTNRIMMATVPHVTAWTGRTKYQADGVLFDWVHSLQFSWNPNYRTLDPDRPQHDRPATCAMAQQYSSATLVSLRSQHRREKYRDALKDVI